MDLDKVKDVIEKGFQQDLEKVREMVRHPSISATGEGIYEMANKVLKELRSLGAVANVVPTEGHPIVYGHLQTGAPNTMLVYSHYDVQPAESSGWSVPPFSAEIVEIQNIGKCIMGRGTFNSKGPMIGFLNVLQAFFRSGENLPLNFIFLIEGEEEMGGKHLPPFVQSHKEELSWAKGMFIPMVRQMMNEAPVLYVGAKGMVYLELLCRGGKWGGPSKRSLHGGDASWIGSPVWRMIQALSTMLSSDGGILIDGFMDDVIDPTSEEDEMLQQLGERFDHEKFLTASVVEKYKMPLKGKELLREHLFKPTLNIDGISGGYIDQGTKNTLPHEIRVKLDSRLVPKQNPKEIINKIRRHLDRKGYPDIQIDIRFAFPPVQPRFNDPVIQSLIETYRDYGREPEIWPRMAGSIPLYVFTDWLGISYVSGGLGHGSRNHTTDEYLSIEGLKNFEKSIAHFLVKYADKLRQS